MTENQRRWLYRYLAGRGIEGIEATRALCTAANVHEVNDITKATASALIDAWQREAQDAAG